MKTNAEEFRNRVGSGQIKLLGTVSPRKVWTDSKGMAIVRYTVSNVGGNQRNIASERVSASYEAGVYRHEIDVGYDFVPVPRIPKGLQIASHTAGRHCHKDLARFLKLLGQLVANAKWKRLVTITAASLRWGGLYPPHLSHQHGGTLDLRPMSTNGKETWCNQSGQHAENYDRHHTRILVRALKHSGAAKLFFNDPKLAADGAVPLDGHHDHIHVSWLKSAALLVSVTNTELRSIIAAG